MTNRRRKIIKNLVDIFKKKDIIELKNYLNSNNIKLKLLNNRYSDVLIIAIDCCSGINIIKNIIQQCQYDTLNYTIENHHNYDDIRNSPLSMAIRKKDFTVADYLIDNGADINYFSFHVNDTCQMKYLISRGMDITNAFIKEIISQNKTNILRYIFKQYIYNDQYILSFIEIHKRLHPLSNKNIQNKIEKEKNKINFNYSLYKMAINKTNYEAVTILLKNDNRDKKIIMKNIFQIFNNGSLRESRFNFINYIKDHGNFHHLFDECYFENLGNMEEKINDMVMLFKSNDLKGLKTFVKEHHFPLNYFNYEYNDLLILSIENTTSVGIIRFIIQECHYDQLNYTIYCGNKRKSPLLSVLALNKFKIADVLLNQGFDINYKINGYSIPYFLFRFNQLNKKNFKYILSKNIHISIELINKLIKNNHNDLLQVIFKHYLINQHFVLKTLSLYKNRISLSNKQLQEILNIEYNKLKIDDITIKNAFRINNYKAIQIMYNSNDRIQSIISKYLFEFVCNQNETELLNLIRKGNFENMGLLVDQNKYSLKIKMVEETQPLIKNAINNNDLWELKKYMDDMHNYFPFDYLEHRSFDPLVYAVDKNVSHDMIKYIIQHYSTMNYIILDMNYQFKSPLITALIKNNFEIADILIRHHADINYKIHRQHAIIHYLYQCKWLNHKNLKYLINHHCEITSDFIEDLIVNLDNTLLKKVFNFTIFDPTFIIKFLNFYKNQTPIAEHQLTRLVLEERNKIPINKSLYETAINECPSTGNDYIIEYRNQNFDHNHEAVDLFLDYDISQQEELLGKINDCIILYSAIKHNNHELINKILNHELFDFHKIKLKKVIKNTILHGEMDLLYHFLKNSLTIHWFDFESIKLVLSDMIHIIYNKSVSEPSISTTTFMKFILERFFNHSSFNFKNYSLENILLIASLTRSEELLQFVIESSLNHPLFDFKKVNYEKVLLIINSVCHDLCNPKLLIELSFSNKKFEIMDHFKELLLATKKIENDEFTVFVVRKLLDFPTEHELFSCHHHIIIKELLMMVSRLKDRVHTEIFIRTILRGKIVKFNDIIIERLLQAANNVTNINLLNYYYTIIPYNYKISKFTVINVHNFIIIGIQNNNINVLNYIFQQLIDKKTFDFDSIHIDGHLMNIINQ